MLKVLAPRTVAASSRVLLVSVAAAQLRSQARHASTKAPPRPLPPQGPVTSTSRKASPTSEASASTTAGNSASPGNVAAAASISGSQQAALARNRKLTPAAKAKAQASASRALREQLASTKSGAIIEATQTPASARASDTLTGGKAAVIESSSLSAGSAADAILAEEADSPQTRRLLDVVAYATAESYDFDKLIRSGRLGADWQLLEDEEVLHVPQWPPSTTSNSSGGEVFIFRSGSYVTWGMNLDQSRKFLRSVIQGRLGEGKSAEVNRYSEVGDEAMEYIVADDQITRVVGDVIVIGQAPRLDPDEHFESENEGEEAVMNASNDDDWSPLLARLAFSQGLSRSARLGVQEEELNQYLEEVSTIPGRLAKEGKVPLHRKEVIRKMGTLLQLRQRANLDSENFLDDPDMYWENWKVEHHYDSICTALDIETRFKAYNEKLDHGENLLGVLRALLTEASTHRMELIIIYLIAFEVCLALISHEYVPSPKRVWDIGRAVLSGQYASLGEVKRDIEGASKSESSEILPRHDGGRVIAASHIGAQLAHNAVSDGSSNRLV